MWPDVLNTMANDIRQRCLKADSENPVPVYLGASAGVPTVDQINVVRGRAGPGRSASCPRQRTQFFYIEVWANPERTPEGETDEAMQNSLTLPGYERLNELTQLITDKPMNGVQYIETLPDNDAFRPICASRLEFKVTI